MVEVSGGEKFAQVLSNIAKRLGNGTTELKVGFLEGATYPDGTPVALVAAVQNYGAPSRGIPPRPFFSNMVATKQAEWGPALGDLLVANGYDAEKSLKMLGEGIAGQLRQSIVDTNSPPNSPVTNLLKERFPQGGQTFADVLQARHDIAAGATASAGKPLSQSGHLLNSVDYAVTL